MGVCYVYVCVGPVSGGVYVSEGMGASVCVEGASSVLTSLINLDCKRVAGR